VGSIPVQGVKFCCCEISLRYFLVSTSSVGISIREISPFASEWATSHVSNKEKESDRLHSVDDGNGEISASMTRKPLIELNSELSDLQ